MSVGAHATITFMWCALSACIPALMIWVVIFLHVACPDDLVCYFFVCCFHVSIHFYDYSNTSIYIAIGSIVVYLTVSWFVVFVLSYIIFSLFCLVVGFRDSEYLQVVVCCIFEYFLSLLFVSASLYVKYFSVKVYHK